MKTRNLVLVGGVALGLGVAYALLSLGGAAKDKDEAGAFFDAVVDEHRKLEGCLFRDHDDWLLGAAEAMSLELPSSVRPWWSSCTAKALDTARSLARTQDTASAIDRYTDALASFDSFGDPRAKRDSARPADGLGIEALCEGARAMRDELSTLAEAGGRKGKVAEATASCAIETATRGDFMAAPPSPWGRRAQVWDPAGDSALLRVQGSGDKGDVFARFASQWQEIERPADALGYLRIRGDRMFEVVRGDGKKRGATFIEHRGDGWRTIGEVPKGFGLRAVELKDSGPLVHLGGEGSHRILRGDALQSVDVPRPASVGSTHANCTMKSSPGGDAAVVCHGHGDKGAVLWIAQLPAKATSVSVRVLDEGSPGQRRVRTAACGNRLYIDWRTRESAQGWVVKLDEAGSDPESRDIELQMQSQCVDETLLALAVVDGGPGYSAVYYAGDAPVKQFLGADDIYQSADRKTLIVIPRGKRWGLRRVLGQAGFAAEGLVAVKANPTGMENLFTLDGQVFSRLP